MKMEPFLNSKQSPDLCLTYPKKAVITQKGNTNQNKDTVAGFIGILMLNFLESLMIESSFIFCI